jgi:hypothetical protein
MEVLSRIKVMVPAKRQYHRGCWVPKANTMSQIIVMWPNTVGRNRTVSEVKSSSALCQSSKSNRVSSSVTSLLMSSRWEHKDKMPKAKAEIYR